MQVIPHTPEGKETGKERLGNVAQKKRTLAPVLGVFNHCLSVASYPV